MPRRGENIYKRKDGRWEGRFKPEGFSRKYKYVCFDIYGGKGKAEQVKKQQAT